MPRKADGWARRFDDAITTPDGAKLRTLREAAEWLKARPKRDHKAREWEVAVKMLIEVAEGRGPMMLAEIGVKRFLHRGEER